MSAIFGCAYLDGRPVVPEVLQALKNRFRQWGEEGGGIHQQPGFVCGQTLHIITPENHFEQMPVTHSQRGLTMTAIARLDNRRELCDALSIDSNRQRTLADSSLVFLTYCRWGKDAPSRLFGDWSFAVWDSYRKSLFLARDHFGNSGLFYTFVPPLVVFASHSRAMLPIAGLPLRINENRLLEAGTGMFIQPEEYADTWWQGIRSLLPGHQAEISSAGSNETQYWNLENLPNLHIHRHEEYLEGFLEHFRQAVQCRLRGEGGVASTLSAGLDSGTVTALAARDLASQGKSLHTFTSVPRWPIKLRNSISDEWTLASRVVDFHPNIIAAQLRVEEPSPLFAMRHLFRFFGEPLIAASNAYWIDQLLAEVSRKGIKILLTGQLGNGGVSWNGGRNRLLYLMLEGEWRKLHDELKKWCGSKGVGMSRALLSLMVRPIVRDSISLIQNRLRGRSHFLNLDFIHRMKQKRLRAVNPFLHPDKERFLMLFRNAAFSGPFWQGMGARHGLEVRDPTVDARLLEFCLKIPDELQVGGSTQRLVIRQATKGLLPDEVRWNKYRGKQGADIVLRLNHSSRELDNALADLTNDPNVSNYVDIYYLKNMWKEIQAFPNTQASRARSTLLLRWLMVGWWIQSSFLSD